MLKRPKFWQVKFSLISILLIPFSFLYEVVSRQKLKQKSLLGPIPIICVGNFIAGGAGKTPTALYIADQLNAWGKKPFILMRGFGGNIKTATQIDIKQHNALEVGDEALMSAKYHPTIIGSDRFACAQLALQNGADIAIMDDGFQNPFLHKDLSLLVIDDYGLGNGRLLPSGPLREKPANALKRADAVIVISENSIVPKLPPNQLPMIFAKTKPIITEQLPKKLIAFAGIASPEKFWRSLVTMGLSPIECHAFGDHHNFSEKEVDFLLARAKNFSAELITTEKDIARLQNQPASKLAVLAEKTYTLPIMLKITSGKTEFQKLLKAVAK